MEANPGTVDRKKLEQCRRAGVNRISIGAQSLRNEELALLGRVHSAQEFYQAYGWAREAGFENINVDLMAALPGQRPKEYRETLRKAADLGPEHISAYSLIVEEGTPFYDWYGEAGGKGSGSGTGKSIKKNNADMEPRTLSLPSEEEERLMDKWSGEILAEYGYRRYEISNYARPGYECRYGDGEIYLLYGKGSAAEKRDTVRKKNGNGKRGDMRAEHTGTDGRIHVPGA